MEMLNCPKCGKLFTKMSEPLCEKCTKEEEELFNNVRLFLEDNKNSTISEVSEKTGASVKKILKYIKDGRLDATPNLGASVICEKCGRPIKMGRYCDKCIININQGVTELFSKKESGPRVFIRDEKK